MINTVLASSLRLLASRNARAIVTRGMQLVAKQNIDYRKQIS
jgi:hypothetical protein